MRWRASIECVDPNELRAWLDEAREDVDTRMFDKGHWRDFDSACRFSRNEDMRRLQTETHLSRSDCYHFARLELRLARIYLDTETSSDRLGGIGHLIEAARYRDLARGKWGDLHDHPRQQFIFQGPIYDAKAQQEALPPVAEKPYEIHPVIAPAVDRFLTVASSGIRRAKEIERLEDEEWERVDAEAALTCIDRPIVTGDLVIPLLRELMSHTRSKFTVMRCDCGLCASGRYVAVDQTTDDGLRHFTRAGLRRLPGEPSDFLAWERRALRVDRVHGTLLKLCDSANDNGAPQ